MKGGVSAGLRILSSSTRTSISPVGSLGLAMPSGRGSTRPRTPITYSLRRAWALACTSGFDLRVEHHLGDAFPVAQIDENDAAVVPAAQDPAHQHHLFAHRFSVQGVAVMGSSHVAEDVCQWSCSFRLKPDPPECLRHRPAGKVCRSGLRSRCRAGSPAGLWVAMLRSTAALAASSLAPRISTQPVARRLARFIWAFRLLSS